MGQKIKDYHNRVVVTEAWREVCSELNPDRPIYTHHVDQNFSFAGVLFFQIQHVKHIHFSFIHFNMQTL